MDLLQNNRPLLDAFRRGDRHALTEVYFHYVDAVARLVQFGFVIEAQGSRIPGAPDVDVEHELIQEVFVRAFSENARLQYDGIRPYRPYLLRIAKNLLVDRLRRKGQTVPFEENSEDVVNEYSSEANAPFSIGGGRAEEDLHWQRLAAATTDYVASQSAEMRELIRLRFDEERSQQEVAEQMSISRRRVRTLEAKAQAGLRRHLKRLGLLSG